LCWWIRI